MAMNFSSKQQQDISSGSIKTKFYTKDTATIKQLRGLLRRMLDDLDNFF